MMKGLPELLAPAGGIKQLIAAVENGADAVYIGGRMFNARQNAANFDDDELKKALEYAHIRGVNVYVAMNILINDFEMEEALECAGKAYEAGADALIVQDIGFAGLLKENIPDLPLHLSTQGTIYSLEGVKMAEQMGFSRVILARELSLKEIEFIAGKSNIELEIFVHGALCQCYSGQCLMSAMIGGRSGNRGICAQPCRLPYSMVSTINGIRQPYSDRDYFLSPKDLCTVEFMDKLIESGVSCFKIEGRMKSPEYTAVATKIYRKYLDRYAETGKLGTIDPKDIKDLKQIYNRGGFTTGYLFEKQGKNLITWGRPKHWGVCIGKVVARDERKRLADIILYDDLSVGDGIEIANEQLPGNIVTKMQKNKQKIEKACKGETVTVGYIDGIIKKGDAVYKISDKSLNKNAGETFAGKFIKKIPVSAYFKATRGNPIFLKIWDENGNEADAESEFVPQAAVNKPLTSETAADQIGKTGNTPFCISDCYLDIEEGVSVPLSEINLIRRNALEILGEKRKNRYPERKRPHFKTDYAHNGVNLIKRPLLSAYLHAWADETILRDMGADRIYLPFIYDFEDYHAEIIKKLKSDGVQVFIAVPPVTSGEAGRSLKRQASELKDIGAEGILIGNIGHIELFSGCGLPLFGDSSLNIYNSESLVKASQLGLRGVMLSPELNDREIKSIRNNGIETEVAAYGRIPVMVSENCPIGSGISGKTGKLNCGLCLKGSYYLRDRTGAEFPVLGDPRSCRSTVLNCNRICRLESVRELLESGVGIFRMYIYDENPEEIKKTASLFKAAFYGKKDV